MINHMETVQHINDSGRMKSIFYNILTFLSHKKNYLYLLELPVNKKVRIRKYDSSISKTAGKFIRKINKALPQITIYFIGSAGLGIAGVGDIDLIAPVLSQDFNLYLPMLVSILGQPSKKRKKFIEWECKMDNYPIEFTVADPNTLFFKEQMIVFNALKKDGNLLQEYKNIKKISNNLPIREYQKMKMKFFNNIVNSQ